MANGTYQLTETPWREMSTLSNPQQKRSKVTETTRTRQNNMWAARRRAQPCACVYAVCASVTATATTRARTIKLSGACRSRHTIITLVLYSARRVTAHGHNVSQRVFFTVYCKSRCRQGQTLFRAHLDAEPSPLLIWMTRFFMYNSLLVRNLSL